jgi:uncharacterized protein DUF1488
MATWPARNAGAAPANHIGASCTAATHAPTAPFSRQQGIFMPLVRDREQFEFERFEGVYFWMKDRANHVLCKVSHEALRDRNICDGGRSDLVDTFVRHRPQIEMIAGEKYDQGYRDNDLILILSKDLTPLPT